jgi:ankyrin repeat protein
LTAFKHNNIKIIKLVLNNCKDLDKQLLSNFRSDEYEWTEYSGDTLLLLAIRTKNIKIIKTVLNLTDGLLNIYNSNYTSPLSLAMDFNSLKIIKLLFKNGAIIDDKTFTFYYILYAVSKNNINIIKLLYKKNYIIWTTSLIYYCFRSLNKTIIKFITSKININIVDFYDRTALIYGCQDGETEVVKELLNKGADVSLIDHNGNNALFYAYENKHEDIILLLENMK